MIDALRVAPGSPPGIATRDPRDDLGPGSKAAATIIVDVLELLDPELPEPEPGSKGW